MATPSDRQATLTFVGAPSRLECIGSLERPPAKRASVALSLGGRLGEHRSNLHLLKIRGTEAVRMRFTLPPVTPAGRYQGSAHIDGEEIPVVVDVQPRLGLAISPGNLFVEASAGAEATTIVALLNRGNVACDIGKAYVFRLFDNSAYDRALAAALRDEEER